MIYRTQHSSVLKLSLFDERVECNINWLQVIALYLLERLSIYLVLKAFISNATLLSMWKMLKDNCALLSKFLLYFLLLYFDNFEVLL